MVYETLEQAAADVGLDAWLCRYLTDDSGDGAPLPSWDAPLTDEQFANVEATAEKEGW